MNLVFVSAGLIKPKKGASQVLRRNRYLNYGLLSLANSDATSPRCVFHGHFDVPEQTALKIAARFEPASPTLFLVSCPSFLSLEWTAEFLRAARAVFPQSKFVLGGRWVVDGNVAELSALFPEVDRFVEGIGEPNVGCLISEMTGKPYIPSQKSITAFTNFAMSYLDYRKLDQPEEFVPSFELSRGCGAGCAFCSESNVRLTQTKPAVLLCDEIGEYRRQMVEPLNRCYLETSLFSPRIDWVEDLINVREARGLTELTWRTEARVDMFTARTVKRLKDAGLRVLDIGLESASAVQLRRMKKAKSPYEYLRKAEELMRCASDEGIMTKVNILLFPGESERSISETIDWLDARKKYITGVSVYPTVFYGFDRAKSSVWDYYLSLGASVATTNGYGAITMMNLSEEVPAEAADSIAREISRRYMDANSYFRLKSFSYFDPRYSMEDFRADLFDEPDQLGFRVDGAP